MTQPRFVDSVLVRDGPLNPARTALLLVDVQNKVFNAEGAEQNPYFHERVSRLVMPNLQALIARMRDCGGEVIYTVMENMTDDGRDRSLDYKLSGFFIAKGSWEAGVCQSVAPAGDDIVLPKTSSSVFNSTNIAYLLRNIGIDTLIVTGFLTDQCVDHTVRDAADIGFYPLCVSDACATYSQNRHDRALEAFGGYCRTLTTAELLNALPE
ncbi:cysteine hydrolase family protein [Billgrantia endophytica]|uniref:Cysteine hydrolase n=1 Tax=Billgrantia endophytica TaxID=2033802 RepID=A0A2N7UAD8_9GAMM|nr:isochorismatase family cysteine hydrolase [Halomonas endophytica]PMR77416.1 cysteine hydrolase [Halomonas endophytica]